MKRRAFFREVANSFKKATAEFVVEVSKPNVKFLRPPGSADEDTFLSLCTKCGSCVDSCQTGVLEKIGGLNPVAVDTPFMNFENNYCEKCYACVDACPSGALSRENLEKYYYVAKIDRKRCVAYSDIFCQTCYWSCPNMEKALKLEDAQYPFVDEEFCKGCGKCIHSCPTIPKSIRFVKREKVKDKGSS